VPRNASSLREPKAGSSCNPAHRDRQTGYRYYTISQLAQLNRITALKESGFSLAHEVHGRRYEPFAVLISVQAKSSSRSGVQPGTELFL
jgi:hypothetical protein